MVNIGYTLMTEQRGPAPFVRDAAPSSWRATPVGIQDLEPLRMTADPDRFRLLFRTSSAGRRSRPAPCATVRRSGFTATAQLLVPTDDTLRLYAAVVDSAV